MGSIRSQKLRHLPGRDLVQLGRDAGVALTTLLSARVPSLRGA